MLESTCPSSLLLFHGITTGLNSIRLPFRSPTPRKQNLESSPPSRYLFRRVSACLPRLLSVAGLQHLRLLNVACQPFGSFTPHPPRHVPEFPHVASLHMIITARTGDGTQPPSCRWLSPARNSQSHAGPGSNKQQSAGRYRLVLSRRAWLLWQIGALDLREPRANPECRPPSPMKSLTVPLRRYISRGPRLTRPQRVTPQ